MGPEPLVSVICRTKDRHELLAEAVESVAVQTYPYREMVVVNDGGASVSEVLDAYRDRLVIRHVESPSVGRCRAGNLALEHSRGEILTYLDDDDLYLPDHLATIVRELQRGPEAFVYTDAWRSRQRRSEAGRWEETARDMPWAVDFSRVALLRENYIHLVSVGHRRELFERLGGFDETLEVLEDHDLWFRYAQDYDFRRVPRATAIFRIRDDGTNAVTALRRDFVATRALLMQRYAHVALPEVLTALDEGRGQLAALTLKVEELEQRLERLEGFEEEPGGEE